MKKFEDFPFAERFRQLTKNIDEKELAAFLSVTDNSFRQWKNGHSLPTCDKLLKLSEYFGVSADYLLGKAESKTADNEAIRKVTGLDDEAIEALATVRDHTAILSTLIKFFAHSDNKVIYDVLRLADVKMNIDLVSTLSTKEVEEVFNDNISLFALLRIKQDMDSKGLSLDNKEIYDTYLSNYLDCDFLKDLHDEYQYFTWDITNRIQAAIHFLIEAYVKQHFEDYKKYVLGGNDNGEQA